MSYVNVKNNNKNNFQLILPNPSVMRMALIINMIKLEFVLLKEDKTNIERWSVLELFEFCLHPLQVIINVMVHGCEGREQIAQLLPNGLHQAVDEPDLILVHALHAGHLQALRDLQVQPLLLPEHLAELVAQKGAPGDVVTVVGAGVADVAGVEDLLDGHPLVLAVPLHVENSRLPHLLELLQVLAVERHVRAQD
jgi:hypothetical protein